jgi:threo-3-hydroxy-L-aspartate ammonia-lyase
MIEKIETAYKKLENLAYKTPVLTSETLNKITGCEVFLKCENLQRVGAFKFRGAYNAVSNLSYEQKKRGVIAYSSGNHAQGVALACRLLGVSATIVMPDNAPKSKIEATKGYGAEVVIYNPERESREEIAAELQKKNQLNLIPPYDHEDIVAGQGTACYEFHSQVENLNWILTPCGGGGLLSGTAIASKHLLPSCKVAGVEPELGDDATRSFYTKTLQTVRNPPTIADGVRTPSLGVITFPLVLKYVDEMFTVSEEEIKEAVRFLFLRMKIVVEPSGALGVAALMSKRYPAKGRVGVVLSGGNIDADTIADIFSGK